MDLDPKLIADVFDWIMVFTLLGVMYSSIWVGNKLGLESVHIMAACSIPALIFYGYKVLGIWNLDHDLVLMYSRIAQFWFGVGVIWTLLLTYRRATRGFRR